MIAAADGAFITALRVVRFDCTTCGTLKTSVYPMNEREIDEFISKHLAKHGGRYAAEEKGER